MRRTNSRKVFRGGRIDGKPDMRDAAVAFDIHQREGLAGVDAAGVAVVAPGIGARSAPGRKVFLRGKIAGKLGRCDERQGDDSGQNEAEDEPFPAIDFGSHTGHRTGFQMGVKTAISEGGKVF